MGIKQVCFFPFMRFDSVGEEETVTLMRTSFDVNHALEELPPDVSLRRHAAVQPTIMLSNEQFLDLQPRIPPRFQGRRWRLLFSEAYHGFSRTALQHCGELALKESGGKERPSILLLSVGLSGQIKIGAYLSCIPQPSGRKYTGSEETFVFCQTKAEENEEKGETPNPSLRFFTVPTNAPNRYFVHFLAGTLSIGGGGKGPAILLHDDLLSVSCSTACPTFGLKQSLLLMDICDGELPAGVSLEGGEPRAEVRAIQLWTIGDENFLNYE